MLVSPGDRAAASRPRHTRFLASNPSRQPARLRRTASSLLRWHYPTVAWHNNKARLYLPRGEFGDRLAGTAGSHLCRRSSLAQPRFPLSRREPETGSGHLFQRPPTRQSSRCCFFTWPIQTTCRPRQLRPFLLVAARDVPLQTDRDRLSLSPGLQCPGGHCGAHTRHGSQLPMTDETRPDPGDGGR